MTVLSPILLSETHIDNPGLGNCAFYAYAVGLINIIQEENIYKSRFMFNRWKALDPSISDDLFEQIIAYELNTPSVAKTPMLDQLQASLRVLSFQAQLKELHIACSQVKKSLRDLEANDNYLLFVGLYQGIFPPEDAVSFSKDPVITHALNTLKAEQEAERVKLKKIQEKQFTSLDKLPNISFKALVKERNELMSTLLKERDEILSGVAVKAAIESDFREKTRALLENQFTGIDLEKEVESRLKHKELTLDSPWVRHEDWALVRLFLKIFYGKDCDPRLITPDMPPDLDSPIVQALKQVTQEYFWGTHLDLVRLSIFFDVNFHYLENGEVTQKFNDTIDKYTITINNKHNTHWTSQVTTAHLTTATPTINSLSELKLKVLSAGNQYITYSEGIWFSLFHHHGAKGRMRATDFTKSFIKCNSLKEANEMLLDFLKNEKNGNTHPHSYRTMLLQELISNDPKPSLKLTSEHYDVFLSILEGQIVNVASCTP